MKAALLIAVFGLLVAGGLLAESAAAFPSDGGGAGRADTSPTATATSVATATPTRTLTPTSTASPTPTVAQQQPTATFTATPPAAAATSTFTPTSTRTRTPTATATAPAASTPETPPDGSTASSFERTLTWSNPPGTTQVQFQLLPYNGDGPGADIYIGSAAASFRLPGPPEWYGLLPDMTYTWQVRTSTISTYAAPEDPSWSPWTKATFRTPAVSSTTIRAVSPAPGSSVNTLTPRLQWANSDSNVWYYQIRVSKDPAFANAMVYSELIHGGVANPQNSYGVPAAYPLEPGTTYYWQVKPRVQGDARQLDSDGNPPRRLAIPWSTVYTFRSACIDAATNQVVDCGPGDVPIETPSPIQFVIPAVLPPGIEGVPYRYSFCTPDPGAPGIASDLCYPERARPGNANNNPRFGHEPYHFQKQTGSQFWQFGLMLNTNGVLDGIPAAGTRTFTICAIDLDEHERCATTTLTIGPAPAGLPAPTVTASMCTYSDHIHITWSAVTGAASYNVYRNTLNSNMNAIPMVGGNAAALQGDDYYIVVGTTYYYWVRAVDAAGTEGDWSAGASGQACAVEPVTFTITSASCKNSGMKSSWGTGAIRYEVVFTGTASGPEGTRLDITPRRDHQYVSGQTFSSSWGDGKSSYVTRGAGQPAKTDWNVRFYYEGYRDWYLVNGGSASHPDYPNSTAQESRKVTCIP